MSLYIRRFTPNGTIKHTKYFCLMAEDDNVTFTITIGSAVTTSDLKYIEYSTDQGKTWTKTNNSSAKVTITTPAINHGKTVLLRGQGIRTNHGNATNVNAITNIRGSGKFNTRGCIMTLLSGITADETTELYTGTTYTFGILFSGSTNLTSAKDLILPPNMTTYCYYKMFQGCTKLLYGPTIPTEVLPTYSCGYMYDGCTNLKYIKLLALDVSATNCMSNWVNNVQTNGGEFWMNPNATWWRVATNGIRSGWTVFDGTEETAEEANFIDTAVTQICITKFGNRNGGTAAIGQRRSSVRIGGVDGKILRRQIESITYITNEFANNQNIVDFSDFTKFTRLVRIHHGNSYGFYNDQSLTAITIPPTVTSMTSGYTYSNGCFGNCTSLTSFTIPDSVTMIGSSFFQGCTNLKTIRWSSNLSLPTTTAVDNQGHTFADCQNLETITNPPPGSAITKICNGTFRNCKKLDFTWLDTSYITKLGRECFSACTQLPNSLIFPSITSLASGSSASYCCFSGMGRKKIYLPSCQTILSQSFSGTSKALELIDLGNVTGSYFYPGRGNTTAQTVTVVMRSTAVPTFSTFNVTNMRRLYVYQDILNDFVTQYTAAASLTYAIGGAEWVAEFGSSSEWADYPNGQAPTIPT